MPGRIRRNLAGAAQECKSVASLSEDEPSAHCLLELPALNLSEWCSTCHLRCGVQLGNFKALRRDFPLKIGIPFCISETLASAGIEVRRFPISELLFFSRIAVSRFRALGACNPRPRLGFKSEFMKKKFRWLPGQVLPGLKPCRRARFAGARMPIPGIEFQDRPKNANSRVGALDVGLCSWISSRIEAPAFPATKFPNCKKAFLF